MTDFRYVGTELDLFANVRNWKTYWSSQLRPFISGDVAEVGAGSGSNTPYLDDGKSGQWACLEPDAALAERMSASLPAGPGQRYEVICGTLGSMAPERKFDTIIYIDVIEHIEDDAEELRVAASRLRPGGHLIMLSPAHQTLYSPFDKAIGHFRRYDRPMIRKLTPPGMQLTRLRYLDCVGMGTSAANLLVLRQSMPTAPQLQFWDRWIVPLSRRIDFLFGYALGKTIIAVWKKP